MANMSHCRFQNTVRDVRDCIDAMDEVTNMSDEEKRARTELIKFAVEIAENWGHEVGSES